MNFPLRTFLFCPASRPDRVEKAFSAGADAVIIDLEDAVAIGEKEQARSLAAGLLRARVGQERPRAFVRVNSLSSPYSFDDFMAVVGPGLHGVVLPKAETAQDVQIASWLLDCLERKADLPEGQIELIPLVETAAGVGNAEHLTKTGRRVSRLAFGALDYTLDLGTSYSSGGSETFYARARLVVASRMAGILPPVDTVYPQVKDQEGLHQEAMMVKQLGFFGKLVIHPAQVAPVNELFTPSPEELAWARKVDFSFAEAERQGVAAIQVEGKFIDYPVAAQARRLLAMARDLGLQD